MGSFENGCTLGKGFLGGASGKEPARQCRRHQRCEFDPWVREIPWRRTWQPTPVFLPGKFHKQWSLMRYSPGDCKKSDLTERLNTHTHCLYLRGTVESFTNCLSLLAVATLTSILFLQHQACSCLPGNFRSFKPQTRGPP